MKKFLWKHLFVFYFKDAYGWSALLFKDESGVHKTRLMPCASITSDLINEKETVPTYHMYQLAPVFPAAKPETRVEHFQCHS